MEIQQTEFYTKYIRSLGWTVYNFKENYIIAKKIPFLGIIAKIQRPEKLPPIQDFIHFLKSKDVKTIALEPTSTMDQLKIKKYCTELIDAGFRINKAPFLPTKTILVNIKPPELEIFNKFSEAKRRAVRRAQKNGVITTESSNIDEMLRIKNKSAGFLGFITTFGINKLWPNCYPNNGTILLAYDTYIQSKSLIGGILLLFYDSIAYYWIAGATKHGKQLFAPTLLVWEAIKVSKKHKCTTFDFVGVWDERSPKENKAWLGFTKFKEGFGGETLYYPVTR